MTKLQYLFLAMAALALAAVSFWLVNNLLNEKQESSGPGLDTVVNMKVSFQAPSGTRSHSMRLACKDGKPLPATRGFNLDIPRQAKKACQSIVNLPSGDYTCQALSGKKVMASGSAEGVVKGRKLKASFELVNSKSCARYQRFWKQFQDVWNLKGLASKADQIKASEGLKKSKQTSKENALKLKKELREAKKKIQQYDQRNKQFLAPGAKTSN